jgi:hypothetical protein
MSARVMTSGNVVRGTEIRIRPLVDLDGGFPGRATLLTAQRLQVSDREPFVRDDGQHAGPRATLMESFNEHDFWGFHGVSSGRSA